MAPAAVFFGFRFRFIIDHLAAADQILGWDRILISTCSPRLLELPIMHMQVQSMHGQSRAHAVIHGVIA